MTTTSASSCLQFHRRKIRQREDESNHPKKKPFAPDSTVGERLALFTQPQAFARQRPALES